MKTKFFLGVALLAFLTACESTPGITTTDETETVAEKKGKNNNTSINFNNLASIPKPGTWKVTFFQEDATIRTTIFATYTFTFNASNQLKATKNGVTTDGLWGNATDSTKKKLYMRIGTVKPLSELTEDWIVLEETATKMVLKHVSGGNGGTDLLTMEVQ